MTTTAIRHELAAATWSVDPIHSTVGFAVKYMAASFRTEFDRYEATLDTTGDEPRLYGSVAPDSIVIKDPNFHAHLQSPDFFDTERHPAITFESTSFRTDGDQLVVDGNLTIKGETRPVEGRGELTPLHEDLYGNERVGVRLEAVIDRSHFGVSWNAPLPKGGLALANETKLVVDLFFVKS
jgi:polyisoprenoid-binding protein YceI